MTKCKVCGKEIKESEFESFFENWEPLVCSDECGKVLRDKKVKENYENDKTPTEHQGGVSKHIFPQ